ncbi:HK97 family phage prohead protease [Mycolicibacterium sp. BK634]|uniref:HK97 family phage prohead protease n=1 Tax=Mycolicibacterium sp. BK634 TaxID=2587099 RepID=UPI00161DE5F8|nr:HK97 family phage prohead protease [Mycolicibacterium sp. BK634]MBB3752601.1 HK97 family phage prohead protease [Mycolicibacterium sp. BK634]
MEIRDNSENPDTLTLTGYASTFEPYEMYGGPAAGGWIEQIDPHAFDKTLREKPDLHLLVNHEGWSLGRTKSGTLKLGVDGHGLRVESDLDRSDPDVQRLEPKMRRKDMDEMSFAFRVKGQEWRAAPGFEDIDEESYRLITEISLHKGDVSVVNFGANPTTQAAVRALRLLEDCDPEQLAELRSGSDLGPRGSAILELLSASDEVETPEEERQDEVDETDEVTEPEEREETSDEVTETEEETGEVEDVAEVAEEIDEREITLESVLADIESAGLVDAVREAISAVESFVGVATGITVDQIREVVEGIIAEREATHETEETSTDEERADEVEEDSTESDETEPRGMSLLLALSLDED